MRKGFTLIELVIVIAVMGIMAGGFIQWLRYTTEKARIQEDRKNVEMVKEVLTTFALEKKRLPTQDEFNQLNFKGFAVKDLSYFFDPALQTNVCGLKSTILTSTSPNNIVTPNLAFVIVTNGTNTKLQTEKNGNSVVFKEFGSLIDQLEYDDIYTQMRLEELQATIDCEQLKIINPQLHTGYEGTPYSVSFVSTGGTGVYTYSMEGSNLSINIDEATGLLSWTNPVAGSWPISVTVSSGDFTPYTREYILVIDPISGAANGQSNTGGGTSTVPGNGNGNGGGNQGNGNGNGGGNQGNGNGNGGGNQGNGNGNGGGNQGNGNGNGGGNGQGGQNNGNHFGQN